MADKELTIVGGANGSGKTTWIRERLAQAPVPYLSADLIAAELGVADDPAGLVTAGREFLRQLDLQLAGDESFIVESTLSGKTLRRAIERARVNGFEIRIVFVFLDHPDSCVARVEQRRRKGGHNVPELDIRRRYPRSFANFWTIYRPLADNWLVVYNSGKGIREVAVGTSDSLLIRDETVFQRFLVLAETEDDDAA